MEIYTTDSIPLEGGRPIAKAWAVAATKHREGADGALAALKAEAAQQGADAVVAVRLVAVPSSTKNEYGVTGGPSWTAYGTAVKRAVAAIPFAVRE